jgi:hypothetical protein
MILVPFHTGRGQDAFTVALFEHSLCGPARAIHQKRRSSLSAAVPRFSKKDERFMDDSSLLKIAVAHTTIW